MGKFNQQHSEHDIIIAGGGISGLALAYGLVASVTIVFSRMLTSIGTRISFLLIEPDKVS